MSNTPTVRRNRFRVLMDLGTDAYEEMYEVECRLADQLKAENTARRLKIEQGKANGQHMVALWLWAAMVRLGHFSGDFHAFATACISYDDLDQADDDGQRGEAVDPTPPGESFDSPSR